MEFDIPKRLKELREKKGLTVYKLAQLSGYSYQYIKEIEDGAKSNPSIRALMRICNALGVSLIDFLFPGNQIIEPDLEPWVKAGKKLSTKQRKIIIQLIEEMVRT